MDGARLEFPENIGMPSVSVQPCSDSTSNLDGGPTTWELEKRGSRAECNTEVGLRGISHGESITVVVYGVVHSKASSTGWCKGDSGTSI